MPDEIKTLRERLTEEIKNSYQSAQETVARHTSDILGDSLRGMIDDVKNLTKTAFTSITSVLSPIFGRKNKITEERQLSEEREQTGLLTKMLAYFRRKEKKEMAMFKDDKGGIFSGIHEYLSEFFGAGLGAGFGAGAGSIILKSLKGLGIFALIGSSLALAVQDGIKGWIKSEDWSTSKISGIIGQIFGGSGQGLVNAFTNAGKWAVYGATIGLVGGFPGVIAGGLVGAAIGGIMGYFGGEVIAKSFDSFIDKILAGNSRSLAGQFKTSGTWAGIGALMGIPFGPPGIIVGGLVGAALGGIIAFFGGDKIGKSLDSMGTKLSNWWEKITSPDKWWPDADPDTWSGKIKGFIKDMFSKFYDHLSLLNPLNWWPYGEREAGTGRTADMGFGETISGFLKNMISSMWKFIKRFNPVKWGIDWVLDNTGFGEKLSSFLDYMKDKFLDSVSLLNPLNWWPKGQKETEAGTGRTSDMGFGKKISGFLGNMVSNMWKFIKGFNPVKWGIDWVLDNTIFGEKISNFLKNIRENFLSFINRYNPLNWWPHGEREAGTGRTANMGFGEKIKGFLGTISNRFFEFSQYFNPLNWGISWIPNTDFGEKIKGFIGTIREKFLDSVSLLNPLNWWPHGEREAGTGRTSDMGFGKKISGFLGNMVSNMWKFIKRFNPIKWGIDWVIDNTKFGEKISNFLKNIRENFLSFINRYNPLNWWKDTEEREAGTGSKSSLGFGEKISGFLGTISNRFFEFSQYFNPLNWGISWIPNTDFGEKIKGFIGTIRENFLSFINRYNPLNWWPKAEVEAGTGREVEKKSIFQKITESISSWWSGSMWNPSNWNTSKLIDKGVNIIQRIVRTLIEFWDRMSPFVGKDSKTAKTLNKMREKQEKMDTKEVTSDPKKGLEELKDTFSLINKRKPIETGGGKSLSELLSSFNEVTNEIKDLKKETKKQTEEMKKNVKNQDIFVHQMIGTQGGTRNQRDIPSNVDEPGLGAPNLSTYQW